MEKEIIETTLGGKLHIYTWPENECLGLRLEANDIRSPAIIMERPELEKLYEVLKEIFEEK